MRRRMAGTRTTDLARQELLLQIGVLVRLDGAEARRKRMAAETRVDVEGAVERNRQRVPSGQGAHHVHEAGHLRVYPSPDAVAAVAGKARRLMWNEAARVVDGRQRLIVALQALQNRRHHVTRAAERRVLRA